MFGKNTYEKILEPGRIGSVKTRNRIIKTGAGLLMWHEDDLDMREDVKAVYESIAQGGVGLLIVEAPVIDYPWGVRWRRRYRLDDDKYIKGMSQLVEVIKKHNCPTFMQMNHDGPWQLKLPAEPNPLYEGPPVAASAVSVTNEHDNHNEIPRPLTVEEIEMIIDKFASAAVRAEKAGFDGVDINAGSSHLFHNFLSPFWNRREDDYGGNTENRTRFLRQTIQEIKKRLGNDFPVSVVINGMEVGQMAGIDNSKCITPEESRKIAVYLDQAGADAIQVRNHWIGYHVGGFLPDTLFYPEPPIPAKSFPEGYYTKGKGAEANKLMAAGIKKEVSVPVTVVGRLDHISGERILREGKADFIGMTRRLQADPDLPNKLAAGQDKYIRPCTACDFCLGSRGRCRVNGLMGTTYCTLENADKKKKVLVIGGGPAGMEAARVSAVRGHSVVLYEKLSKLGGLMPLASVVKGLHPENLVNLITYFKRQMKYLNVKYNTGKEVNLSMIKKIKPDAVFLAAGGILTLPDIPGINNSNVISGPKLHGMLKFFLRFFSSNFIRKVSKIVMPLWLGKRIVVIGGGIQGCELGEFFVKRGRKVTIVEKADDVGEGMTNIMKEYLLLWFEKKDVKIYSGVMEFVNITDKGLTIIDKDGNEQLIEADNIVPAMPLSNNIDMIKEIKKIVPEVYAVGDCKEPKLIADAIGEALKIAREI
ncbi:MAG: FAD-dependent oxidoreductase [Spirochaetes bacterium]|nr:FAD-dependent oxidoreductase [Spirochaetota bacterium]